MLLKKGAMFGLDARIALAIFGALSVISGAALYSAIQDSKVTAALTEMSEVAKAVEAYALDTGSLMPIVSNSIFNANELVTSTITSWQGPYISDKIINHGSYCTNCIISKPKYTVGSNPGAIIVSAYKDNQSSSQPYKFDTCTSGPNCTVRIGLLNQTKAFLSSIDKKVDGVADVGKGRFRVSGTVDGGSNGWLDTGISVDQL